MEATKHLLNWEPQQPASKPSGNGEITLREALKYPKLKDTPVGDLQAVLRRCMLMVGIRAANLPGDEEKAILLQFIYKHFGNLTIAEIQLAFEKAVAGEIEAENCYENFTCAYFGRIMTSYKQWASRQWNENQMYVSRETPKNQLEMKADWKPLLEMYYQDYLANKFNLNIMPFEVYGAAMELGYMSADAWEDWEGTARDIVLAELQAEKFEAMHENEHLDLQQKIEKVYNGEWITPVENLAKKLSVELLFKEAKKQNRKNIYNGK